MMNLKTTFIVLVFAALFADGCSKKEAASTPPPTGRAPDSDVALQAQLRQLNIAIGSFSEMTGRYPTNFQELVDKKFLSQVPTPPLGKTFILNQQLKQVQLVDQ